MESDDNNSQKVSQKGDKAAKKLARDERLKKSLRANLQRRKAKMRALKTANSPTSDD